MVSKQSIASYRARPVLVAVMLLVFMINMPLAGMLGPIPLLIIRLLFVISLGWLWWTFRLGKPDFRKDMILLLLTVNLAFLIASVFQAEQLGIDLQTARGIALAKSTDAVIICSVLLAMLLPLRFSAAELWIKKGRLWISLLMGLATFAIMGFLSFHNPNVTVPEGFIERYWIWILVFVFANAIMEEFLFRGIFFSTLLKVYKPIGVIMLTAVIFALAHAQVTYTPDTLPLVVVTFVLGGLWAWLMYYTQNMLASILFHAGADLILIIPLYSNLGVPI
jgi:membrane protease YdiL (CAAX protease family)